MRHRPPADATHGLLRCTLNSSMSGAKATPPPSPPPRGRTTRGSQARLPRSMVQKSGTMAFSAVLFWGLCCSNMYLR